jgi:nitrite reductase/ring-hydroxylating ferredoxin subunit
LISETIPLGDLEDITLGTSRGYALKNAGFHDIFVIRVNQHEFYAYRNSCPHQGYEQGSMAWRKHHFLNADGSLIQCGSHGALFEIASGLCVQGPCKNQRLEKVEVSCDSQGQLQMHLNSKREL